ncbi:MAG: hypothetical protein ACI9PY_001235 [Ascidiaceihabitans sp.]|jgi:hypothetical protein
MRKETINFRPELANGRLCPDTKNGAPYSKGAPFSKMFPTLAV